MGPWAIILDDLDGLDRCLVDSNIPVSKMAEYSQYCSRVFENFLPSLSVALNHYHQRDFSDSFWRIILSNWFSFTVNILHFYFTKLEELDALGQKYTVLADGRFFYGRLSDTALNAHTQEFIHSIMSKILTLTTFQNINYENSDILPQKNGSHKSKKNIFYEFLKNRVFAFLNNKNSKFVVYGIRDVDLVDKIFMKLIYKNLAFSYKDILIEPSTEKEKNVNTRFELEYQPQDDFEALVKKYIQKYIPMSILEDFEALCACANDYKKRSLGVASPGFYQDEQLIELALIKENGGKVLQAQEAGQGYSQVYYSQNYMYKPVDYYLTWGWTEHVGFKKIFIPCSSPSMSKLYNLHKEKYDSILYLTKYPRPYGDLYETNFFRNIKKYYGNRVLFMETINRSSIKEKLLLKFHQTAKYRSFDEGRMLANKGVSYNEYSNPKINKTNAAMVYIDYLSAAMYEVVISNTPFIMCLDPEMMVADKNIVPYIEKFKDAGVIFETPEAAAEQMIRIYDTREEFWKKTAIQNARKAMIENYIRVSKTWGKDLYQVLQAIDKM